MEKMSKRIYIYYIYIHCVNSVGKGAACNTFYATRLLFTIETLTVLKTLSVNGVCGQQQINIRRHVCYFTAFLHVVFSSNGSIHHIPHPPARHEMIIKLIVHFFPHPLARQTCGLGKRHATRLLTMSSPVPLTLPQSNLVLCLVWEMRAKF